MSVDGVKKVYYCPVEITLDKIGGKWKPLILWHLRGQKRRFGNLKKLIPTATEKMLTEKLRELEKDGLVCREVYPEVPPRVEYSLTPYGRELEGLMQMLCKWGAQYAKKHQIQITKPAAQIPSRRVAV